MTFNIQTFYHQSGWFQKDILGVVLLVFWFWGQQVSAVQVPGGPVKDSKGLAVQSTGRPKKSYEEVHGKVQFGFFVGG